MKRTTLILTFLLALFGSVKLSVAQNPSFTVSYDTANFPLPPGIPNVGDTLFFPMDVTFFGAPSYIGDVHFVNRVNYDAPDTLLSIGQDTFTQGIPKSYTPTEVINGSSARYGGGINVVVIWPAAPNVTSVDSAYAGVEVNGLSVEGPNTNHYTLEVYPNPSNAVLRFKSEALLAPVESLSLHDIQGRLIRKEDGLPDQLDLSRLPTGMYFLHVSYKDGGLQRFRLLKQ